MSVESEAISDSSVTMNLASSLVVLLAFTGSLPAAEPQLVPIEELGKKFELVGALGVPLGKTLAVEGVAVHAPEFEQSPFLEVQRINGKYTQENIQIPLMPALGEWEKGDIDLGQSYEFMGYESGAYIGISWAAKQLGDLTSFPAPGHHFRSELKVLKTKEIAPIEFTPAMFPDSKALLEGVARTKDFNQVLVGKDWSVLVARGLPWPAGVEGKAVETFGRYKASAAEKNFDLVDGEWRLVRLEDQVGNKVTLRGTAWGTNENWTFDYRGYRVHVEAMAKLPGWERNNHGRPVIIIGRLERGDPANSKGIPEEVVREQKEFFVVRDASWKPFPALLAPELKSLKQHSP